MLRRRDITQGRRAIYSLVARLLVVMMALGPISGFAEQDGGGGGGGGSAAGDILQGIAQNIQAVSPIVTAGIQAAADKQIAQINANANVAMTQISADTSKYVADVQSRVALYQAETAQKINEQNQEGQTTRLGMQLDELRLARTEQLQDERERLRYEKSINDQRIRLAYQQEADNVKLARMTLQTQLIQQGFSSGFVDQDSGSRLKVASTFGKGSIGIPTRTMTASVAGKGPAQAVASARPQKSFLAVRAIGGAPMRGIRAAAPRAAKRESMLARLMASIKHPGFTSMRAGRILSRGLGMNFGTLGGPLRNLLQGHLAAGSSAALRHRTSDTASLIASNVALRNRSTAGLPQSDLATFHAAVQSPGRSPASEAGERHRGALSGSAPVYSTDPASFGSFEGPSSISGGGHRRGLTH